MILPPESTTYLSENFKICRIINGMWQVSGSHGYISKKDAIKSMNLHVENGFITWDLDPEIIKRFKNKCHRLNVA